MSSAGRECYHCKQWVEAGEAHDCWTTTEAALTNDLPEDLPGAIVQLRDRANIRLAGKMTRSVHAIVVQPCEVIEETPLYVLAARPEGKPALAGPLLTF